MATYTCITCRVAFGDAEVQRAHYKSDWHRYNLKRKVAAMGPVSAEGFQERVRAQRAVAEPESKGAATYCAVCGKRFASFNAYENHLQSRRHAELERAAVRAVSRQVQLRNAKNLEKGLGADGVDKDALNAAIQQAIKARPAASPAKAPAAPAQRPRSPAPAAPDRPPRLQWLEQRARRLARRRPAEGPPEEHPEGPLEEDDDDWEDIDSDEELECEDADAMDDVEEQDVEEEEAAGGPLIGAIPITDCLFCPHHSSSLMKNVAHMTKVHSFFIPDIEYLSDLKGLIKYLGEKVGVGKICLWCNEKGKSFYSTEAVQAHMNDKSHCKLFTDGNAALEFADFYDFRSSYPDHKEGDHPDETEELPSEKTVEYDDETMELILPSGARVGHRSLMRYYKQRFGLSRAVAVAKNQKAVGRILQQYRALGWTGSTGAALLHERDMQYVQRMKSKWMLKTGMKNNATKQMHFRPQVRF
ncbi:cytoplasmic 60S subunit biogenesis factor ZNF622 [Vulpes vulpes]|uniref:Cytoplasmic 60S subunit biogenesis factor ZNF622 n=1 Tax=Vulpes vulpes TaxID=9627 RepID=A0A3Q7SJ54_VULVU|nr:zinc finger protein 622 [Vulpes lagopus]